MNGSLKQVIEKIKQQTHQSFAWGQPRSGMTIAFLESLSHNFRYVEEITDEYWRIGFSAECQRRFLS